LLRSQAGAQYKGWHLILLLLLIVGTYQKQLIRNSLFALFLVPSIFWVWHQICAKNKINYLWFYPAILGVWSCLHGSYLLGFGLVVLILTGDTLDIFRGISKNGRSPIAKYIVVIFLSFVAISLWNPTTQQFYSVSRLVKVFKTVEPENQIKHIKQGTDNTIQTSDKGNVNVVVSILRKLNNTIFNTSNQTNVSGDFVSPFDRLDRFYIWIALFSGVLGLFVIVFLIRPIRLSVVIPFILVLLAGLGYVRLCGYIPLVTAAIIFQAAGRNEIRVILSSSWVSRVGWMILLFSGGFIWSSGVYHYPLDIGTKLHDFGFGRISTYSNKVPDVVFKEFKDHKVFNTMSTGGYLLYKWYPEKKVFIDGFFAPHKRTVFEHLYALKNEETNPDFLYEQYGIDVALVEHTRGSVSKTFFNSENWYVKYMDLGMICFVYQPDFENIIAMPDIWIHNNDIKGLPFAFKKHIAASLHTIPNSLYKKGRIKDAIGFSAKHEMILKNTEKFIDPAFITMTHQLRYDSEGAYGQINTKAQYYEYKQFIAIETEDYDKVISYGLKVIEINPERLTIAMNIVMAYSKLGLYKKSQQHFEQLIATAKKTQPEFIADHKKNISKMYLMLSLTAKQNQGPVEPNFFSIKLNNINA